MARLLLLLTGGTMLMTPVGDASGRAVGGASIALDPWQTERDLVAEVPSLGRIADTFDTRHVFHMDSANMQPADWMTIASVVHEELPRYDGIVVVHGTDTMAYTASALAMILGPLPKPVVLTGSQKPIVEPRTDARQNLIDAAMVATLSVPEVMIVSGARALRGARAIKRDAWGFAAFDSPTLAPLVELGIGISVSPAARTAAQLAPFDARLEPRVLALRVFPGLDPALIRAALAAGVRGLVLEAYGTGNLPMLGGSLIPVLDEADARRVPVVVVSQCLRGHVDLGAYEGGAAAAAAGVISGGEMTVEAALAKLMVGLGRFGPGEALSRYMTTSIVGERSS